MYTERRRLSENFLEVRWELPEMVRQPPCLRRSIAKTWSMAPTVLLFALVAAISTRRPAFPMYAAFLIGSEPGASIAAR
ncbi:hypothetical protein SAMN05414137_1063 [Streptacidiphilus jiangxiensis]|uniref:Uncharacterized protein n=1 Tax=Streptacidiphilus jiangxiensis TaxID=235985 RepID=A0A1H7MQ19_STRJI|nr:hypothetical protein SAMN05414137_1063 [Streptacidiphilus jiangxiensis]